MPRWPPGRMQPPLRARSFLSDQQCRSLSASAIRPVRHSVPLWLSIVARPHEVGLVDSWRADSLSRSMARSRNYPMCKNTLLGVILELRFPRDLRGDRMKRFVERIDRGQSTLFPECVEDWISEDNPVRVIDVFV